ncbi:gamma-glutamyltransferase [Pacificimonas sp. WHA3]|uniref:Glutathione hydrolase proenzyme n=1 Tax=Pacificimonas pallii TaxID=2827236 RepID=A0ABS6SHZ1_9SPHN|nr:gamma-glutamyltransferase [Pacificimonas pallii]MBV7257536.1 gamma-glutamyltransferase [Pacificimonas pallii]
MKKLASLLLLAGIAACAPPQSSSPFAAEKPAQAETRSEESYTALVSAAHPEASAAGAEILAAGGSAADAAIATLVALTVVEPQSSGIGGGGFLIYHDAESGRTYALDGRETAPRAATPDMWLDENGEKKPYRASQAGGMSVGIPGNLRLMEQAHKRFGKLPWSRLFQPSIRLARGGWEVSPRFHAMLGRSGQRARMTQWARATFYNADDTPRAVGTRVTNPALANFLERISREGPGAFYSGRSARSIVDAVTNAQINPQVMTTADLGDYTAIWRDPVCGTYRSYRICGMPPPSSGGTTVIAMLKQLERFDLASLGADSPEAYHLIAESMRLAFADREAYLGDPDFVSVPTMGLIAPAYTAARSKLIDPARAAARVTHGTPAGAPDHAPVRSPDDGGTSHFVTADRSGDVASLTSTIESVFGSGLTVNGYFLNNELTDFSFSPAYEGRAAANAVAPGKRPRSSMSPTIVYAPTGEVAFAIGAAGGPTIIAQTAKAIIGVIDFGLSVEDAIGMPQVYAALGPTILESDTVAAAFKDTLTAKGHKVRLSELPLKANGLARAGRGWIGAADPRSEGTVEGIR